MHACAGGAGGAQGQQSSVVGAGAGTPVSTVPMEGANTGNPEVRCLKPARWLCCRGTNLGVNGPTMDTGAITLWPQETEQLQSSGPTRVRWHGSPGTQRTVAAW